ncbi:transmembrane protein 45B-like [Penaeus chinensis]|uniref:transmembrane protein 45B-like n=1 Tax=Penaeus chinensis TaxID=139456 RepID=UPI001FB78AC0|nr:transmembrane protein 45B-like [Penaeus chinensis]XP_047496168.1 transmembrane protein 45B-like [Penaeus chinensis]
MGSFMGHILPGSLFFAFGMWWAYNIFFRYFLCLRGGGSGGGSGGGGKNWRRGYRSTPTFSSRCCSKIPMEAFFKIAATSIGIVGEFVTAFKNGKFTHLNNAQHMTMYFFFGLSGVMDLAIHYRLPVPPDVDYVSAVLAFMAEGVLFYYHLHGRSHMDIQIHMFLFYLILSSAVSTIAEMCRKSSVLPALCRAFFTLYQGTWFIQVAFLLYPPPGMAKWDEEDHGQMMIVTLIFCWHAALIFIGMAVIGRLAHTRVKCMNESTVYQSLHGLQGMVKMDPEQVRRMISDESEAEEGV